MDGFNFQDLTDVFTVTDVIISLVLSFVLSLMIGWVYQITHKGVSYTQSFVQTLVVNGMVVAVIMLIIGSNIARAFALVGALSIIRFRNAIKETRDVGFIFFTMAIGMAVGTQFYLLAVIAAIVICLLIIIMSRFNWFSRKVTSQLLKIQLPVEIPFEARFDSVFLRYTEASELISVDSIHNGMITELTYSIGLKSQGKMDTFLSEIKQLNGNHRVTMITGYHNNDL